MSWFGETVSERRHREILAAIAEGRNKVVERINALHNLFRDYVERVEAPREDIAAAVAEAIRADDAAEDDAFVNFRTSIEAALAKFPPKPTIPPAE